MLLNDSRHMSTIRLASHDAFTNVIASMASSDSVSTSASFRVAPLADLNTVKQALGGLVTVATSSVVLSALPNRPVLT